MTHYSAVVLNLEDSIAMSRYVARCGQANNAPGTDFSSIVPQLKCQIVGGEVSSNRSENVRPINNFIDVVVNEKGGIAGRVRSQIISDA
jgi:hypothetical protein